MSWLPVATAARAFNEMVDSPNLVLHLRHPTPRPLSPLISSLSEVLKLDRAPFKEWLQRVKVEYDQQGHDSRKALLEPALRLMGIFEYAGQMDEEAVEDFGLLRRVEMVDGLASSATLQDVKDQTVGISEVESSIAWWRKVGFLPPVA